MNNASEHELKWLDRNNFEKIDMSFSFTDKTGSAFNAVPDLVLIDFTAQDFVMVDYKHRLALNSIGKIKGRQACETYRSEYDDATRKGKGRGTRKQRSANAARFGWNHSVFQKSTQAKALDNMNDGWSGQYWVVDPSVHRHMSQYREWGRDPETHNQYIVQQIVRENDNLLMLVPTEFRDLISQGNYSQLTSLKHSPF
jgi:hypothetical protein